MKQYMNIFLAMMILLISASCSTVEKITVIGNPGEKIYTPSKQYIATIPQNGNVKISIESDAYYGYLFTYNKDLNQWIPFALDIKKKSHNGTKFASGAGYTLSAIGLAGFLGGSIAAIADSESEAAGILMILGAGIGGIGASFGVPASYRMGQLSYQYNFGYNSRQYVNSDLRLTQYVPPKMEIPVTTSTRKKATSGESTNINDASSVKSRKGSTTSTAKKKRKTSSELIAGEYFGSGTLVTIGEEPESIGTMKIIITPKDENTVVAEILEDNEDFFESEEIFTVKKNKDATFTLTHTRIPSVKFTISKSGKVFYKHPKVNIDDSTYTLSITADKSTK